MPSHVDWDPSTSIVKLWLPVFALAHAVAMFWGYRFLSVVFPGLCWCSSTKTKVLEQEPDPLMDSPSLSRVASLDANAAPARLQDTLNSSAGSVSSTSTTAGPGASMEVDYVELEWRGLSCCYDTPQGEKWVLDDVFGGAQPGEMQAILGPSGAGKSTLMDMLARRKCTGSLYGTLLVNGSPATDSFISQCSYVPQQDNFIPVMTAVETMQFYAGIVLPRNWTATRRETRVQEVLRDMGLASVQRTLVGGALPGGLLLRGLSGGERKRLSIAAGVLAAPGAVFLDEPTTGLDAFAALTVMGYLKRMARDHGHAVMVSIHQPRAAIWSMFDTVSLLSCGRLMYHGICDGLIDWFSTLGYDYDVQIDGVLSDWALDLVACGSHKATSMYGPKTMATYREIVAASAHFVAVWMDHRGLAAEDLPGGCEMGSLLALLREDGTLPEGMPGAGSARAAAAAAAAAKDSATAAANAAAAAAAAGGGGSSGGSSGSGGSGGGGMGADGIPRELAWFSGDEVAAAVRRRHSSEAIRASEALRESLRSSLRSSKGGRPTVHAFAPGSDAGGGTGGGAGGMLASESGTIKSAYREQPYPRAARSSFGSGAGSEGGPGSGSWLQQFGWLYSREMKMISRNPADALGRTLTFVWVSAASGVLYYALPLDGNGTRMRLSLLANTISFFCIMPYVSMSLYVTDKRTYLADVSAKLIQPTAYYLSKVCATLPIQAASNMTFVLVSYGMTGLRPEAWAVCQHTALATLMGLIAVQVMHCCAVVAPTQDTAFMLSIAWSTVQLLFNNFSLLFREIRLPWMVYIKYISAGYYTFEGLAMAEFRNREAACSGGFDPTFIKELLPNTKLLQLSVVRQNLESPRDANCNLDLDVILKYLGLERTFWESLVILVGYYFVCHVLTFTAMLLASRKERR